MLARFVAALLRRRAFAAIVLLGLIVLACAGALRLRVDFSSASFYGGEPEMAERLAAYQAAWGADDDLLLVLVRVDAARDDVTMLTPGRLQAVAELSGLLAEREGVTRVDSLATAELPRPRWLSLRKTTGDPETIRFAELAERLRLDELPRPDRRELLERLPVVPTLLSIEGDVLVIVVELAFSSDDVQRTAEVVGGIEALLREREPELASAGMQVELAGVPAIRAGFFELLIRDQALFVPLTLALIGLALFAVFRRLHGVLIPAIAAGVPTLMLVGILGWVGEPIGLLNQAYFTLLPVIALADAIHMVARFHEQLAHCEDLELAGAARRDRAIAVATQRVGLACLLTSVTTAAGFASLLAADMPILRSFGLYAALGITLAFVLVLVLVPLLLSFVAPEQAEAAARVRPFAQRTVTWCGEVATRRPKLVLGLTAACTVLLIPGALRVEIDNTLTGLVDSTHPLRDASARVDAVLGGTLGLELDLRAPADVDMRDPEVLERLLAFEGWLAEQEQVRAVEGLAGWLVAGRELLGRGRTLPRSTSELEATISDLVDFIPLERYWQRDADGSSRTRIHVGLPDIGGQAFAEFADTAERELQARLEGTGIEAHATGTPLLAYRGVNRITHDLRASFGLLFGVIVLVLVLLFRRIGPALLALPANLLPLFFGYALLGVLGIVLDPLAAVILTLALGIAVDDTLHVLVRVREQLGGRVSPDRAARERAVHEALRGSGRAVVITSLVIVGGLALNLLSSFPPLQLLGLLGSLVLLLALAADLLVLPAMIVLFGRTGSSPPPS